MTFYDNTRIEYWQSREQLALRRAFQESRKSHTLSRGDRELPTGRFRYDLLAVNSFSRRIWGRAISNELSRFLCDGGDGTAHNRNVYFVSLMDVTCARSPGHHLTEADLQFVKNRLRYGLREFSYFGMVEPAYYVNLQQGVRYNGKRCLFWHLHALVWGVTSKELKKRLRKLTKAGRYTAIADGLDATHTRKIKQGRLPRHLGYVLKSPCRTYRVSVRDREDKRGRPITDADGVVLRRFKHGKSALRHGDRIVLFHAMKHLHLDRLAVAGGDGAKLLRAAKRAALSVHDTLGPQRRTSSFRRIAERRRRKLRGMKAA
ncbi:hypothetical protein JQ633_33750 [Bradyrhizobium tropiciagri]|uniref:hypothetical protein n=1 Tax=Bradyrhizobium tropiciagri TaxID=312253 RepID=UPI001BA7BE1F|nr:hypothetical protein [Bradyrhizobium tropiciagri]MBR0875361.1 hypothetical protein [Bradyrhizobium tropiciagri]